MELDWREMEHETLSRLLETLSTHKVARTADCPDDHEMAALVDGKLPDETKTKIIGHLADCDYCLAQVGLLKRLRGVAQGQSATELILARARRAGKRNKLPALRSASRWAAAAMVVLAFSVVFVSKLPDADTPLATDQASPESTTAPRQYRNRDTDVVQLRVIAPVNGAAVALDDLKFAWTEVPGSLHYDVRVVTDEGDLVWQAQVETNELDLPGNLGLHPGNDYFFRVDAYLSSARHISSQHVMFSIGEEGS